MTLMVLKQTNDNDKSNGYDSNSAAFHSTKNIIGCQNLFRDHRFH